MINLLSGPRSSICRWLSIGYRKEYVTRDGRPLTFLTPSAKSVMGAFA